MAFEIQVHTKAAGWMSMGPSGVGEPYRFATRHQAEGIQAMCHPGDRAGTRILPVAAAANYPQDVHVAWAGPATAEVKVA